MLNVGRKIKIIDAGYGAADCNGCIGWIIRNNRGSAEGNGLSENEPHIKILLEQGVYQKRQREYWRVNTPENGLRYEVS